MGNTGTHKYQKAWLAAFTAALALFMFFTAGLDASDRHFDQMAVDLIIGTFAALLPLVIMAQEIAKAHEAAHEFGEDAQEMVHKATEEMRKRVEEIERESQPSLKDAMEQVVLECVDEVTGGGRPPREDEIAAIEEMFHERVPERYLKLELETGGMTIDISRKPGTVVMYGEVDDIDGDFDDEELEDEPETTETTTGTNLDGVLPPRKKA